MRSTAKKVKIEDITNGEFANSPEGEPNYLNTPWDQELLRVNIIATIVEKFVRDDGDYATLRLDDGSETIRAKAWSDGVREFEKYEVGDLVKVIGKVREYEGEIHLVPEVMREVKDPNWELVRELEILEKRKKLLQEGKEPEFEEEEEETGEETQRETRRQEDQAKEVGTIESLGESTDDEIEKEEVSEDLKDQLLIALDKIEGEEGASLDDLAEEIEEPKSKTEEVMGALLNEDKAYEPIAGRFKRLG